MKFIRQAALLTLFGAASGLASAADPALVSFADLYRLTVNGAQVAPVTAAETPLRPVSTEPPAARPAFTVAAAPQLGAGYAFSIGAVPEPQRWLLVLSGLIAAAWVARRRLYSF